MAADTNPPQGQLARMQAEDYLPLVERVARRLHSRLPRHVELDELIALGTLGLLDACTKYVPTRGPFPTYAYWRIRGAILDGLRAQDFTPRRARRKEVVQESTDAPEPLQNLPNDTHVQRLDVLRTLGAQLNPKQLLLILLRYFLGLQATEAAEVLGLNESYVNYLHRSALNQLRTHYRTPDQM